MAPRRRRAQPVVLEDILEEPVEDENRRLIEGAAQSIEDIEQQVQEWVQDLLGMAGETAMHIKHQFQVLLVRLPKQVRDMPLTQFKNQFGGDIKAVLLDDINSRLAAAQTAAPGTTRTRQRGAGEPATIAATSRKRRGGAQGLATAMPTQRRTRGQAAVVETPSLANESTDPVGTEMRFPKLGETFYSARGSPLGTYEHQAGTQQAFLKTALRGGRVAQTPMVLPGAVPAGAAVTTIIHRNRPGSKTGVADGIVITLKDGQQVAVDFDGGLEKVPNAHRKEVAAQLSALQKLASSALSAAGTRR